MCCGAYGEHHWQAGWHHCNHGNRQVPDRRRSRHYFTVSEFFFLIFIWASIACRCSISSVRSYVYADMSLSGCSQTCTSVPAHMPPSVFVFGVKGEEILRQANTVLERGKLLTHSDNRITHRQTTHQVKATTTSAQANVCSFLCPLFLFSIIFGGKFNSLQTKIITRPCGLVFM